MTKNVTKRTTRCAWCGAKLPRGGKGRPRRFCSASHRQRAYEKAKAERFFAEKAERFIPKMLLGRDIDDIRTKAGIERAVIDVLRKYGLLPGPPGGGPRPRLRIVKEDS